MKRQRAVRRLKVGLKVGQSRTRIMVGAAAARPARHASEPDSDSEGAGCGPGAGSPAGGPDGLPAGQSEC